MRLFEIVESYAIKRIHKLGTFSTFPSDRLIPSIDWFRFLPILSFVELWLLCGMATRIITPLGEFRSELSFTIQVLINFAQ